MSCSRRGCDSIMCHTYVDSVGYICHSCQEEFKEYLKINNIIARTEGQIKRELRNFMETQKDEYKEGNNMNIDDFFGKNNIE